MRVTHFWTPAHLSSPRHQLITRTAIDAWNYSWHRARHPRQRFVVPIHHVFLVAKYKVCIQICFELFACYTFVRGWHVFALLILVAGGVLHGANDNEMQNYCFARVGVFAHVGPTVCPGLSASGSTATGLTCARGWWVWWLCCGSPLRPPPASSALLHCVCITREV